MYDMPYCKDEPYDVITFQHHPPIIHQRGRFFYPDGFEVAPSTIVRLLRHHSHFRSIAHKIAKQHHIKYLLSIPLSKAECEYDEQVRKSARWR